MSLALTFVGVVVVFFGFPTVIVGWSKSAKRNKELREEKNQLTLENQALFESSTNYLTKIDDINKKLKGYETTIREIREGKTNKSEG